MNDPDSTLGSVIIYCISDKLEADPVIVSQRDMSMVRVKFLVVKFSG